jgi:hypothetical protein
MTYRVLDRNPDFPHLCPNLGLQENRCAICRWLDSQEYRDQFYSERREIERERWANDAEFASK